MEKEFIVYLRRQNMSRNTILAYSRSVELFVGKFSRFTKSNLLQYKEWLSSTYKPQTVNLRLQGINRYLEFIRMPALKLKLLKLPRKTFFDKVITDEDYRFFKRKLLSKGEEKWYFAVWFMAATGARVSELVQMKAEHVYSGHFDVYSKGGKVRRIYLPSRLRNSAIDWLARIQITTGPLFRNRFGLPLTCRGIAIRLKQLAQAYGLDPAVIYPHSFRHRFAQNFLSRYNDLAMLADLLGHDNIETTRIYLRKSTTEQSRLVDSVVNW